MSIKYFKVKRTYPNDPDLNATTFEGYVRPSTGPRSPVTPYGEVVVQPGFEIPNFKGERLSGKPIGVGAYERSEGQLFTHSPPMITSAFVDHRIRAAVAPTILGLAYNEARKTGVPTYSPSLSKYSSPLVRHALEKGLVQPNESNEHADVTNLVGEDEPVVMESHYKYQDRMNEASKGIVTSAGFGDLRETSEVPEQDVAAAKQTVRNVVRPPKPAPAPHVNPQQFEQLRLDL